MTTNNESAAPKTTQILTFAFLAVTLALAFFGYRQGLPGSFMFDDYPNLQTLSNYGGVKDLASLKLYLDDQFAGPTGRPISMLSFLIDVRDWPANPGPTKLKNVLIHVLNGLVLVWLLTASLRQSFLRDRPREVLWVAALATAWWVLHPYHVSTVLYAIQRMAELAAFFSLLGLAGYVAGRKRLQSHPRQGYALMGLSLVLGTVLATFSKENGALLPLLALILEGTILSSGNLRRPAPAFRALFLWLPAVVAVAYIAYVGLNVSEARIQMRGFGPLERLLTESRIIFQYLQHLIMPTPQTGGIFRDSLSVSTSLVSPPSTLFAVFGIVVMLALGIGLRRRLPLLSAALLFFLAGHLMESTVIPLELYFEHRNYLPSALLFLPVAQVLMWASRSAPKPAIAGAAILTLVLTVTLWARADLWADRTNLYLTWANENPESPRAQLAAVNVLQQSGATEVAIDRLRKGISHNPESLALQAHLTRMLAGTGNLPSEEFRRVLALAKTAEFEGEAVVALRRLASELSASNSKTVSRSALVTLWENLKSNDNYYSVGTMRTLIEHELGSLYAAMRNESLAVQHFNNALEASSRVQTGMMQAAILASNRYYCPALDQLDQAEQLLDEDPDVRRNRDYFAHEIERLRTLMNRDAQEAGQDCTGAESSARAAGANG